MISDLLQGVEQWLVSLAQMMPLPVFTAVGAFVEEIIAPIPSPLVMTLAGSLAASLERGYMYILFLSLVGAIGKTIGAYIMYVLADKLENVVLGKWGRFFGVSHKHVEMLGNKLTGGWGDYVTMFLLRAIPVMPTGPVSLGCGLIKVNIRAYVVGTFLGTIVRNAFYLYVGFTSVEALASVNEGLDSMEKIGYVVLAAVGVAAVGYIYLQKRKSDL